MRRKISSILVTGGAGFIGSHIVDRLVGEGRQVLVLDNLSRRTLDNLEPHLRDGSIDLIRTDIREEAVLRKLIPDVDGVVHLAAITDHETCLRNPELARDVNANGTLIMLETARRDDVKRFVYASSAAVYGHAAKLPISEDSEPAPIAPYGVSKLEGEKHCLRYRSAYGLRTVCLRYFNVFGPRQSARQYSGVITEFMKNIKQGKPPVIHGDGLQTRDFVGVMDIVEATTLALDSKSPDGVYNIATGTETTIRTLAARLIEISGHASISPTYAPARRGDIKRSVANIQKARTEIHYEPKTELQRDLRQLWNWFLSSRNIEG